jgi:hypothetical protein
MTTAITGGILRPKRSEESFIRYEKSVRLGGVTMGGLQTGVALVLGLVVALFVPALVWATVIAGLYQMIRDKIWEARVARQQARAEAMVVSIEAS